MSKQKLFVDFDDTIINSKAAYCTVYNEMFCSHKDFREADPARTRQWNFGDECPLALDCVNDIFCHELFFQKAEFFPAAREVLSRLNEKYHIIICTVGVNKNIAHKALWIEQNLPFIQDAIFLNNGAENKVNKGVVQMANAIFIDDHMRNLLSSNAEYKVCYGHEYDWNKEWDGIRCTDWNQVARRFL